ncbi:GNAT family N-acetyltransferase [Lachnospiraceae bacterium ZAX-1]
MKYIRTWKLDDATDLTEAINNKKILDNLRDGLPFPYTEKDATEFIAYTLDAPKNSQYSWAIHLDGKTIGSIGVFRKENIHYRTAEIGYYIAESYWGRGIVTNAVKEACEYVFANTDIIRIFAEPFSYNAASCKVLEKSGFTLEGVLKKNAVKNGEVIDMNLYSLVKK